MANFIEEFFYGNLDPQARSTKQNNAVQKQMEILMNNEEKLTAALDDENKKLFLNFSNAWSVVNGESNTITVAYGTSVDVIAQPASGYVDATNHNEFADWYTDAAYTTEFTATSITGNITLYAKFTESAKEKIEKAGGKAEVM